MQHCIPDELFNRVTVPPDYYSGWGDINDICHEIHYKLPNAEDVVVRREVWHTYCDFCYRTGALIQYVGETVQYQRDLLMTSDLGKFMRVVYALDNGKPTTAFDIYQGEGGLYIRFTDPEAANVAVMFSVRPAFSDRTPDESGDWNPRVPQYMINNYGECIAHGALARLYAMRNDGGMARMHATAYNNDLNRLAFGRITSGMRRHLLIDVEDWLVNTNGNG